MVKNGAIHHLVTDHLGSARLVVNASTGAVARRLDYDAFGRITQDTNPGFQPFGFAGGIYDADTGLVRFGARDYDPEVGRWAAKDPTNFGKVTTNLYGYSFNDAINVQDPTGLSPRDDLRLVLSFFRKCNPELFRSGPVVKFDQSGVLENEQVSGRTTAFSGNVILNPNYPSVSRLANTVAHELQHSAEGPLGRAYTGLQDAIAPGELGVGDRHESIYEGASGFRVGHRNPSNAHESASRGLLREGGE